MIVLGVILMIGGLLTVGFLIGRAVESRDSEAQIAEAWRVACDERMRAHQLGQRAADLERDLQEVDDAFTVLAELARGPANDATSPEEKAAMQERIALRLFGAEVRDA